MNRFSKWWKNRKKPGHRSDPEDCSRVQVDDIKVNLPLLTVCLSRKLDISVPHEVSIIIPRAEMRFGEGTTELIYSSITVVHAPSHPPAGEQPPAVPSSLSAGHGEPAAHNTITEKEEVTGNGKNNPAVRITYRNS